MSSVQVFTDVTGLGGSWVIGEWASSVGRRRHLWPRNTFDFVCLRFVRRCR